MKVKLYSVRDLKLGFGPVFSQTNDEIAKRSFGYMLQDKPMCDYPQDFELCCVGQFDSEDGECAGQLPYVVMTGGQIDAV